MDRTIDYIIGKEADGLRIAQFLRRKGYSRQNLATIKQMPDSTLVDGAPAYMNQYLRAGCRLTVRIRETGVSEKIVPVHLPLDIVYEDGDIVVVNKPAGMPIHPSVNNYTNTMANALAWYYKEQGKPFIFRCSNRLDRDTSGLTVVAKHLVSAGILSAMTADKTLGREYLAIVSGHVTPPTGTVRAPLARSGTSIVERKVDFEHGEEAVTHYETLGQYGPPQPGAPEAGDGPHPPDPGPHAVPGLPSHRGLPLQPGYEIHQPAGAPLPPAVLPSPHDRGAHGIYRAPAGGYEKGAGTGMTAGPAPFVSLSCYV